MADPLTDERLADIASTHDLCDPDDGPRCEVAELLAEVLRLRGDLLRLADKDPDLRTVYAYELGHNEAVRQIGADRDRYTAVIDQVRALHRQAQPDKGFCEYCDETWPCPTAALLPPATQPADGTGHVHGWEIICVDGVPTHGQCRGCPATQNLETGEISFPLPGEDIARAELARGEGIEFDNADDLIAWLEAPDEPTEETP